MTHDRTRTTGLTLSNKDGTTVVKFYGGAVSERPAIASKIAHVVSSWSMLEAFSGYLLGCLMNAEPKASMALLSRFGTTTQIKQAIEAVGTATLKDNELSNLKQIIKNIDKIGRIRNKFIHSLWGINEQETDKLAIIDPIYVPNLGINIPHHIKSGSDIETLVDSALDKIEYYSEQDINEIITQIEDLAKDIQIFNFPIVKRNLIERPQ